VEGERCLIVKSFTASTEDRPRRASIICRKVGGFYKPLYISIDGDLKKLEKIPPEGKIKEKSRNWAKKKRATTLVRKQFLLHVGRETLVESTVTRGPRKRNSAAPLSDSIKEIVYNALSEQEGVPINDEELKIRAQKYMSDFIDNIRRMKKLDVFTVKHK
jgi:hypothetical protein